MNKSNITAILILAIMFVLLISSVRNESAVIDELAHIPAGFGYLIGDYRLNPEHPPLLKTLAAASSRLFANPHFPTDTKAWTTDINGQWEQGAVFFYESVNDADNLIFWSRLPLMLLAILFGWLFYRWTKKRFGAKAALFALTFFAFSPTFLTHSRYVTTDLGASFAFFIGIAGFIYFLENPSWKNVFLIGLVFGLAQLLKFSAVLLVPLYMILLLSWILARPQLEKRDRFWLAVQLSFKTLALGLVGFLLIWGTYALHTINYPREKQLLDTKFILTSYGFKPLANLNLALVRNSLTRPLGEYMLGFLMVNQRTVGGNTQFFMGQVSAAGFKSYFPTLYLLKEPLAFHLLTLLALGLAAVKIIKANKKGPLRILRRLRAWTYSHFAEFSALVFIVFYWALSISSPLNIGVRHVLPTFPFIYLLVARQISDWISPVLPSPDSWSEWLKNIYRLYISSVPKYILLSVLFFWLVATSLAAYPDFMIYYNELAGGSRNGFNIGVDSNYDWGQDLKRLRDYAEKNNIEKIGIDYFGGGQLKYYFGDKAEPWWSSKGPIHGWFAISATFRQGAFGTTADGFERKPEDSYEWLRPYQPVARVGSIFVYKLP